jgi:hypothetical protein
MAYFDKGQIQDTKKVDGNPSCEKLRDQLHMKHQETWSWPQVRGALNVTSLQLSRRLGILVLLKLCVHKQNLMKMIAERATLQSSIQSSDQSIQGFLSNLCYCLYYNSTTALPTQRVNLWKKRASDTYGIVRIKWPSDDLQGCPTATPQ